MPRYAGPPLPAPSRPFPRLCTVICAASWKWRSHRGGIRAQAVGCGWNLRRNLFSEHGVRMHDDIKVILVAGGNVASVSRMVSKGVPRREIDRALRAGELVRLRRDVLVCAEMWQAAARWERHQIRARAVMHSPQVASAVALSHHSALSLLGVPLFGVDDRVHVVRTDGRRGHSDDVVRVHSPISPSWVTDVDGIRIVKPARAALQVAGAFGVQPGLVSADGCLHLKHCDGAALKKALAARGYGHGHSRAKTVAEHANAVSESAGESRSRWVFRLLDLPAPDQQVTIRDATGQFVARVDFLFREQRTVVEFDGAIKYSSREDVVREKEREDQLRALGFTVVRLTWEDLAYPARVLAKIRQAFSLAGRGR